MTGGDYMTSKFGIVGDSPIFELPETMVEEDQLVAEKRAAKYARTKEFKELKTHFEERIKFYQTFLPSGQALVDGTPTVEDWRVADRVIAEFNAVLEFYENAMEAVDDARQR